MAMKIGYINVVNLEMNPHLTERFQFREATFYTPYYKQRRPCVF